jgi:hypothetical protein
MTKTDVLKVLQYVYGYGSTQRTLISQFQALSSSTRHCDHPICIQSNPRGVYILQPLLAGPKSFFLWLSRSICHKFFAFVSVFYLAHKSDAFASFSKTLQRNA